MYIYLLLKKQSLKFSKQTSIVLFIVFISIFQGYSTSVAANSEIIGTSYYVDSASGDDTNPGNKSLPWAHCPGMNEWTGSQTLTAGDIVYFNNSRTWTGTASNHVLTLTGGVTYDGSSWGTGTRAKLISSVIMQSEMGIVTFNNDHPTIATAIKGFEIDGSTGDTNGIRFMPNNYYQQDLKGAVKRVEDCDIHDCGISTQNWSYGICVTSIKNGEYDEGRTLKNVEILNCKVYRSSRGGLVIYPSNNHFDNKCENIIVRGCEVYNSGWNNQTSNGAGIASKNWVKNLLVEYNYVHDSLGNDDWGGVGINFNTSNNENGTEGIIRYNLISNNRNNGIEVQKNSAKDLKFFGNIINNNLGHGLSVAAGSFTNIVLRFYNNTLYKNGQGSGYIAGEIYLDESPWTSSVLEFKNNIIYTDSIGSGPRVCLFDGSQNGRITAHSNNIYYREGGGNLIRYTGTYYTSKTLAQWENTSYSIAPVFKNLSNLPNGFSGVYGTNLIPDTDGLSIESGIALNNGADLEIQYNGAINLSGSGILTRSNGTWDIGAYEYISKPDTQSPSIPQNIIATPGDKQITLSWDANTESDLKGYNVYNSEQIKINSTLITNTSFTITNLQNSTKYDFLLTACDIFGNESSFSTCTYDPFQDYDNDGVSDSEEIKYKF